MPSGASVDGNTLSGIAGASSSASAAITESDRGFGQEQDEPCHDETSTVAIDEDTAIISGRTCALAD